MNPQNNTPEFNPESADAIKPQDRARPEFSQVEPEIEPATNSDYASDPLGTTINAAPVVQPPVAADPVVTNPFTERLSVAAATTTGGLSVAKRSKKPLILSLVIGGLVLLLGGSAAAYQLWYQNPDKVVTDSLVKALTAETITYTGTLDTSAESGKLKVELDGRANNVAFANHAKATVTIGAVNVVVDGNVQVTEKGDLYFKLQNAKDLADTYVQLMGGATTPELTALVAKIDDKWIKVTAEDLNMGKADELANKNQCFTAVGEKFKTDRALRGEVTSLYEKQRFITVKESLGEKDGNLGYKLNFEQAKAKSFVAGLKETKLYGELQKCDKDFKIDESDIPEQSDDMTGDVEIWADKWSHELEQVRATGQTKDGKSKGTFVLNPIFNKPVTIEAPADAMPVSELQQEIMAVAGSLAGAAYQGIESRADAASMEAAANLVAKYAEAYNAMEARYPTLSELLTSATEDMILDESMKSRLVEGQPKKEDQIGYQRETCSGGRDGATVSYIDGATGEVIEIKLGMCQ